MTWIKFISWLLGIYAVYYTAIILIDTMRGKHMNGEDHSPELTFADFFQPQKLEPGLTASAIVSPIVSSGGLTLKQLYNSAQEEAIEFTRKVSF